jgi:hypothetical protein
MDLTGDERYPGQTMRFRRTIILTKRDGVWRILAGQNAKLREGCELSIRMVFIGLLKRKITNAQHVVFCYAG